MYVLVTEVYSTIESDADAMFTILAVITTSPIRFFISFDTSYSILHRSYCLQACRI
jgi:hypothetical protein